MSEQIGITRNTILNQLQQSYHGKLEQYRPIIGGACSSDPEFLAHLLAWDFTHGQIKDAKIALPVITLASREFPDELVENSVAHLALQSPREMLKSLQFAIASKLPRRRQRLVEGTVRAYLKFRESEPGKWMRLAARHRRSLKGLYSLTHAPAPEWVSNILYGFHVPDAKREQYNLLRSLVQPIDTATAATMIENLLMREGTQAEYRALRVQTAYPAGSIFHDIANLRNMTPELAAAVIAKWHLSPLIVSGALAGAPKTQEHASVVQATIAQMSDTEVVTRAASLQKHVRGDDANKESLRNRIAKAAASGNLQAPTLKSGHKAEEVEDEGVRDMLRELQERQIAAAKSAGRGIDGNWLVIVDRSNSQQVAIKLGVHVGAALAKFVTGRVWLAFCNGELQGLEATGKELQELQHEARFITASGGTSYGVALQWAQEKNLPIDGVIIVGDGGENSPPLFTARWKEWKNKFGVELPVQFFQTFCPPQFATMANGNPNQFENFMRAAEIPITKHDFRNGDIDYFSIPNVVQQIKVSRFDLTEQIMACPLLTMAQAIPSLELAR